MYDVPIKTLNDGNKIPMVGLGTWKAKPEQAYKAVKRAIDLGYRHFDCAYAYGNEKEIGQAIKEKLEEGVIIRENLFITNKLWNTFHAPQLVEPIIKMQLQTMQLDYFDLYLMHSPIAWKECGKLVPQNKKGEVELSDIDYVDTWKAMEKLVSKGLTKSIGVSNFSCKRIERLLLNCTIPPANNQIEVNLYCNNACTVNVCLNHHIAVTAFSPLGSPDRPWARPSDKQLLDDPVLLEIADQYNRTTAQIALKYLVQSDLIVIPKSVNPTRLEENINIFDFFISDYTKKQLRQLSGKVLCTQVPIQFLNNIKNKKAEQTILSNKIKLEEHSCVRTENKERNNLLNKQKEILTSIKASNKVIESFISDEKSEQTHFEFSVEDYSIINDSDEDTQKVILYINKRKNLNLQLEKVKNYLPPEETDREILELEEELRTEGYFSQPTEHLITEPKMIKVAPRNDTANQTYFEKTISDAVSRGERRIIVSDKEEQFGKSMLEPKKKKPEKIDIATEDDIDNQKTKDEGLSSVERRKNLVADKVEQFGKSMLEPKKKTSEKIDIALSILQAKGNDSLGIQTSEGIIRKEGEDKPIQTSNITIPKQKENKPVTANITEQKKTVSVQFSDNIEIGTSNIYIAKKKQLKPLTPIKIQQKKSVQIQDYDNTDIGIDAEITGRSEKRLFKDESIYDGFTNVNKITSDALGPEAVKHSKYQTPIPIISHQGEMQHEVYPQPKVFNKLDSETEMQEEEINNNVFGESIPSQTHTKISTSEAWRKDFYDPLKIKHPYEEELSEPFSQLTTPQTGIDDYDPRNIRHSHKPKHSHKEPKELTSQVTTAQKLLDACFNPQKIIHSHNEPDESTTELTDSEACVVDHYSPEKNRHSYKTKPPHNEPKELTSRVTTAQKLLDACFDPQKISHSHKEPNELNAELTDSQTRIDDYYDPEKIQHSHKTKHSHKDPKILTAQIITAQPWLESRFDPQKIRHSHKEPNELTALLTDSQSSIDDYYNPQKSRHSHKTKYSHKKPTELPSQVAPTQPWLESGFDPQQIRHSHKEPDESTTQLTDSQTIIDDCYNPQKCQHSHREPKELSSQVPPAQPWLESSFDPQNIRHSHKEPNELNMQLTDSQTSTDDYYNPQKSRHSHKTKHTHKEPKELTSKLAPGKPRLESNFDAKKIQHPHEEPNELTTQLTDFQTCLNNYYDPLKIRHSHKTEQSHKEPNELSSELTTAQTCLDDYSNSQKIRYFHKNSSELSSQIANLQTWLDDYCDPQKIRHSRKEPNELNSQLTTPQTCLNDYYDPLKIRHSHKTEQSHKEPNELNSELTTPQTYIDDYYDPQKILHSHKTKYSHKEPNELTSQLTPQTWLDGYYDPEKNQHSHKTKYSHKEPNGLISQLTTPQTLLADYYDPREIRHSHKKKYSHKTKHSHKEPNKLIAELTNPRIWIDDYCDPQKIRHHRKRKHSHKDKAMKHKQIQDDKEFNIIYDKRRGTFNFDIEADSLDSLLYATSTSIDEPKKCKKKKIDNVVSIEVVIDKDQFDREFGNSPKKHERGHSKHRTHKYKYTDDVNL